MTGRARGRGRSRGRGGPAQDGGQARRPGSAAEAQPQVGRGRSRGPPPQAAAVAAAQAVAPPTKQMATMGLKDGSETRGPRGRRGIITAFEEQRTRPQHIDDKRGVTGQKIQLSTNHFKLQTRPQFAFYQYNVSFCPEVDSKGARHGMLNEHKNLIGNTMAFDGMILYLPRKLPDPVTKRFSTRKSDNSQIEITITLTNELPPDSPICVQLYNVVFRRILKYIDMRQVGRNYYNTKHAIEIPQHKLELWPGFSTSILHFESNVLLQADVSHKVLRKATVLDYLYDLFQNKRGGNFHEEATKKLIGEIVLTRYNNKTYRIDDINWEGRPHNTFQTRDGEISFVEYYQKTYSKTITDMDQPLLVSRPRKAMIKRGMSGDLLLIPELCFLTGLSDEIRSDFHVMKDLATHTRVDPSKRQRQLENFIQDINKNAEASAELEGWGLSFDNRLLTMEGRTLPRETIFQRETRYQYDEKSADWSREMRGAKLISTVNLENWLSVRTNRDDALARDFLTTLKRVCGPMGMRVNDPTDLILGDDRTESYLRNIKDNLNPQTQLVVCILPTNRKDRYDSIKKLCCLEKPVPSQVIVSRTISKKQMLMSVATKIGIQLNVKLGGEVWALEIPLSDVMVVGFDTYHDSVKKGRSVGGFVASLNKTFTRYHSRCTFQHTGMELADGLKICMTHALRRYRTENNKLPDKIIFYRDGVGDGQLPAVVEHEIPQLIECFKEAEADYKPKFSFIVVKKRVNTRLFMHDKKTRALVNPLPGSVIDTDVTRKEWYDFFLISQSVRQGTVTPTHYNIVYDTSRFKPDHFQRLTYKLTHLYYNWPGTIRVPAPCQYAHKLAFLVGQSLHQDPKTELADKLFYL